jgi:hypothetical protein
LPDHRSGRWVQGMTTSHLRSGRRRRQGRSSSAQMEWIRCAGVRLAGHSPRIAPAPFCEIAPADATGHLSRRSRTSAWPRGMSANDRYCATIQYTATSGA